MTSRSLRLRLTVIILCPLIVLACAAGAWQVRDAQSAAKELFDRSLLTTALAIVGDIARSGGDALSLETRDLLRDTSGGPVFYHVYAPDGVYVTGFASPPVAPTERLDGDGPIFFDGRYNRRDVRGLRFIDVATLEGISGAYTYTVWQDVSVREAFTSRLVFVALMTLAVIIAALAVVVWFGVVIGLRPLIDLEDAIARRSPNDLSPIQRPVPLEARGMVRRLNALFAQVGDAMDAQKVLISNAAHQLRNPIAGVLALAEAVRSAPDARKAQERSAELVRSARHASDLANKLLTLERVQYPAARLELREADLGTLIDEALRDCQAKADARGALCRRVGSDAPVSARVDAVLMRESLANLIDNALTHGGDGLGRVEIQAEETPSGVRIAVRDDGRGLDASRHKIALSRFGQSEPSAGSGLGLTIANAVARRHGGRLTLSDGDPGLTVTIELPTEDHRPAA